MGWSKTGVDKMAQLQIYKKNGGKIYDLVMAQKRKEQKAQKEELQDELIRELRTSNKRYENVWCEKSKYTSRIYSLLVIIKSPYLL